MVPDVEMTLNEEWLRTIEINVRGWRTKAVDEYNSRVAFLTKLSHLDRFGYPKHFPQPGLSKQRILHATSRSDSLFFPEVTQNVFQWLFECVLSQAWLRIVTERPTHVYLTSEMEVGASEGAATKTIRFDLDYSTPSLHSHPRQPSDIPLDALHLYDENYESGCLDEDEFNTELTWPDIDEFDGL
jgi:hypothetical protein